MAKVMYKSGNYVVVTDANNLDRVFPIGKTVYDETNGNFLISEGQVEREQLIISVADTVNWVDDGAVNYTEATFREFLRANTGFRPASGGSDANVVNSDGTYDVDVPGGDTLNLPDINNIDSDGSVVVTPAQTPFTATICSGGGSVGAMPLKTNQQISYASNDDGDLEEGRATDFFTLASENPFGTTERFTDALGTQVYSDKIAIDWTTYDGTEVLGFSQNSGNPTVNWATCIANASSHSVGIYTSGWRLPNVNEVFPLFNYNQSYLLYYPPFNTTMGWTFIFEFWLSTTKPQSTGTAYQIFLTTGIVSSTKTNSKQWFAVRNFTVNGTTLT